MNRYLYASANPTTLIDPTGHVTIGQGQLCSPFADFCGDPSNSSNPNGAAMNTNPAATNTASGSHSCAPNCQASSSTAPPSRTTTNPIKPPEDSLSWTVRYGAELADIRSLKTPYDLGWEHARTECLLANCPPPTTLQEVLDECGFAPVVGTPCDLASVVVSAVNLDLPGVVIAAIGILPFGDIVKGAKRLGPHGDEVIDALDGNLNNADDLPLGALGTKGTSSSYRRNLIKYTGEAGTGSHAHHIFPKKFADDFSAAGIDNINDPRIMSWWKATDHLRNAAAYNRYWADFWDRNRGRLPSSAFTDEILQYGRFVMSEFGQTVGF